MLSKMYIIAILFLFLSARLLLILSYKCHTNIYIKLNIYTKYIHKVTNKYTSYLHSKLEHPLSKPNLKTYF